MVPGGFQRSLTPFSGPTRGGTFSILRHFTFRYIPYRFCETAVSRFRHLTAYAGQDDSSVIDVNVDHMHHVGPSGYFTVFGSQHGVATFPSRAELYLPHSARA